MPSTSLIPITASNIFDLNGRKNKTITRLFDGDLLTKIDASGTGEDAFVLPFRSMIELPNVYGNMKWEQWESFGAGGTMTLRLYNSAKTLLGTYSKSKTAFNSWITNTAAQVSTAPLNGLTMEQHTTVRFIEIYLPTATDLNIGIFEMRLYGDITGVAESLYPGTTIVPKTDPGRYGHGIGNIDDRVQQYLQGSPSTYLVPLMAGSVRIGWEGMRWDIYPNSYNNPLGLYFDRSRYGTNHEKTRIFDFTTPRDIEVQFYHGGGSIKNLSAGEAASSNGEYHPEVNDFKYIEPGADADLLASWNGKKELIYTICALWGNNTGASMAGRTITGGTATAGQGGLKEIEVGNELTRDWAGSTPYHSPKQWMLLCKACADRAADADSGVLVGTPADTFMDITQWRAAWFEHGWAYGFDTPFPCDIINMNLYLNSDLDGQAQSGDSTGLNPEAWGLLTRLQNLQTLFNQIFPNKSLHITEYGFATHPGSPYDVQAIGSFTAAQVSANMALRMEAIGQLVPLVRKMFYYAFFEDGTGPFNSMGATAMTFGGGGSYTGNTVYPVGYALANKFFIEKNYEYWATIINNGGTITPWITVKNHPTDPLKKLFKVWRPTMNGSTSLVSVPVGPNAVSATRYTLNYASFTPTSTAALISGTNIDITATEGMQWLEVTYETAGNTPPVANAGTDQTIQLPTSQVTVNGSGSTDSDGTITTYAWTKISGPATFTITSPSSVSTTITGLVEGVYVFRLTVTDNNSGTDTDDITITVLAANIPPTAVAGSDQSITLPTSQVTVNGSGSTDSDGTITGYAWSKISGPVAYTITSPSNVSTTITGLVAGVYVFRLTVTDNNGGTGTDDVQITVNEEPGNESPAAEAGPDQIITIPLNFVTVSGIGHDTDGTITGYLWEKVSGPATYTITSPTTATTTITGLVAGVYVFRFTVTDDDDAVDADELTITVHPVPVSNRRKWFRGSIWRNIFRRNG